MLNISPGQNQHFVGYHNYALTKTVNLTKKKNGLELFLRIVKTVQKPQHFEGYGTVQSTMKYKRHPPPKF
jgi:hypothetical protein